MAPLPLNSVLPCATLIGYDVCRAEIRGTRRVAREQWAEPQRCRAPLHDSSRDAGICPAGPGCPSVPPVVLLAVETLRPRLPHYVCAEGHQSRYRSSGAVVSPDHQMSGSRTVYPRMEDTNTP
ncbi:hypothetical protein M431DRAFT_351988 [Trichoderma harzianum CBS 226.95]|uniref:Uncharacterized protein n=1 Tax=Trichoderma harzianum CBS 226.95 TaxID=983964 RepID=A0A2T4ALB1_TRIHA|nr:hypothetical protein M431DRAFT_351988 [Trichoderma harzianum CBS 226.95]PTB57881.1 hypothetical protein M431DRAFT_351988 [Trichoderma harzianum CBS 226.95]